MLHSLQAIRIYESGDLQVLKTERWLMHLALTREHSVNLERIDSLEQRKQNYTLQYVKRSLETLKGLPGEPTLKSLVEQALMWAEVAKAGLPHRRVQWTATGCNLWVHNEGSARIYLAEAGEPDPRTRRIVHTLIATHGLIGQYLRGEVLLSESRALHDLVTEGLLTAVELTDILMLLNQCVIAAVSPALWDSVAAEVRRAVDLVMGGDFESQFGPKERLRRLRATARISSANMRPIYPTRWPVPTWNACWKRRSCGMWRRRCTTSPSGNSSRYCCWPPAPWQARRRGT